MGVSLLVVGKVEKLWEADKIRKAYETSFSHPAGIRASLADRKIVANRAQY